MIACDIEAVLTKRVVATEWQELQNSDKWL